MQVGDTVEKAVDTVQNVQERATEVGKVAKSTAKGAMEGTKQAASNFARVLETEAARQKRIEDERRAERHWWQFWKSG